MDLLASAVGLESFGRTPLRVFADLPGASELRLVVQVLGSNGGWPKGALERVVTATDLRRGVDVQVMHDDTAGAGRVLAWVEPNDGELEFGALTAVPAAPLAIAEGRTRPGGQVLVLSSTASERAAA